MEWTEVGAEHNPPKRRERLTAIFKALDWQAVPCDMALMPAMAIDALVKELRLGKILEVACSRELSPYGLVAVHAQRKRQGIRLYAVDTGTETIPLAHEIYSREPAVESGTIRV